MAVAEDVRLDDDGLAGHAPGGEATRVDLGADSLDDDTLPAVHGEDGLRPARGRTFATLPIDWSSGRCSGHEANPAVIRAGAEIHRSGHGPGARDLPRGRRACDRDRSRESLGRPP